MFVAIPGVIDGLCYGGVWGFQAWKRYDLESNPHAGSNQIFVEQQFWQHLHNMREQGGDVRTYIFCVQTKKTIIQQSDVTKVSSCFLSVPSVLFPFILFLLHVCIIG